LQVDDELAAIARLERAVDHRLDVGQIVGGQAGDQIDGEGGMPEGRIAPHEEGVGDASHARVPRALELGVEQRQFAVHRGALGELARSGAIHLERNSHGGDDVENLLHQAGVLQTIADGAFDLLFVDPPLDLFLAGGIDGADVLHRHGAAGAVVVGDLAGKRDVPVDYQENIFAGLRMQAIAQGNSSRKRIA
jgi:hypothetical protein